MADNICSTCGFPYDEIPYRHCVGHEAYERNAQLKAQWEYDQLPFSEKLMRCEDFVELRAVLAKRFEV